MAEMTGVAPVQNKAELQEKQNFTNDAGNHTLLSPVVGSNLEAYDTLRNSIANHPNLVHFEEKIYQPEFLELIPASNKEQAQQLSMDRLASYIEKYAGSGLTVDNAVGWLDMDFRAGVTNLSDLENPWNTWKLDTLVENDGQIGDGRYVPSGIVAIHELQHVEQTRPGLSERESEALQLKELSPTLNTLIELDSLYKTINNLPLEPQITYGKSITWGGREVDIGEIASMYRDLSSRYGSIEKAILSKESLDFIDNHQVDVPISPNRFDALILPPFSFSERAGAVSLGRGSSGESAD